MFLVFVELYWDSGKMASEITIWNSLQKLTGEGVVTNYNFENDNSFSANLRAKSNYSANRDVTFYNEWCSKWIQSFSEEMYTNWIVRYTFPNTQKMHFKKVYKCHHNNFNKTKKHKRDGTRQRNKECNASITIRFKKINRHTIRNDLYLKEGLDVHIQVNFQHSHKITAAEAYSYLRMAPDTRDLFFKYFEDGMAPAAAKAFHELRLKGETDEQQLPAVLANAQINPTERQVRHLYWKWRCQRWKYLLGFTGIHKYARLTPDECHSRIRICQVHFTEDSFANTSKSRLGCNAIPTLMLTNPPLDDELGESDLAEYLKIEDISPKGESSQTSTELDTNITLENVLNFVDKNCPEESCMLLKTHLVLLNKMQGESRAAQSDTPDDRDEDTKIDIKLEFDPDIPTTSTSENGASIEEPNPLPKRLKPEDYHHHSYDSTAVLHLLREIRDLAKAREDPIVAFFDSMAKTVMKFPPAQAAEVKLKVCQIVTEMECKILEESGNYPENFETFD